MFAELRERKCPWIPFREPAAHFCGLLIRQPQIAFVLFFHKLDDVDYVGLPFRRPCQHPIENFFDLVSGHELIIAILWESQRRLVPWRAPHQDNSALKVRGNLKRQFAAYPHSYPQVLYEFIPEAGVEASPARQQIQNRIERRLRSLDLARLATYLRYWPRQPRDCARAA